MALPAKRSLGALRDIVQARLGFGAMGAATGLNITLIDSWLYSAQYYLYWQYEFPELRQIYDWTTAAGQTLYDFPDVMEPRMILDMRVSYNGVWVPMKEGIDYEHDTVVDTRFYPRRFDRFAQLELWPQPDGIYTVRCDHYKRLGAFAVDVDKATVDDELILMLATSMGKAHYRQPDADFYQKTLNDTLRKLRKKSKGNKRFFRNGVEMEAMPKPVVVE